MRKYFAASAALSLSVAAVLVACSTSTTESDDTSSEDASTATDSSSEGDASAADSAVDASSSEDAAPATDIVVTALVNGAPANGAAVIVHDRMFPRRNVVVAVSGWLREALGAPECAARGGDAAFYAVR